MSIPGKYTRHTPPRILAVQRLIAASLALLSLLSASPSFASHGDANGDGKVDIEDVRLIENFLVGNALSIPRPDDADVTRDGRVTTADALLILQFVKGLRTSFDLQSPRALTALPASGASGVLLSATVSVFFSEPVTGGSVAAGFTVKDVAGGLPVAGRLDSSQDGVIFTFSPDQPLAAGGSYRVDVTTAVADLEGNLLLQAFSSAFQTQALGTGVLVSTNNLSGPINELLAQPIIFKALSAAGAAVRQVPVSFTAKMGAGVFEPSGKRQVTVLTDDNGVAQASFRLGGQATEHTVDISAVGFSAAPRFSARALALPPVNLRLYSGSSQSGAPGGVATFPLVVEATDAGGNPVAATPITFSLTQGQGSFGGQAVASVATNSSGTAGAPFTFGAAAGAILVQAGFPGMLG